MSPKLSIPVYIMQKFVFPDFLSTIQSYRITHLQVAPPILIMLDKRPETSRYDLRSVRNILCGAAPLSRDLQNRIQARFKGTNVVQGWGMTEVTCGAMHVPGGHYDESGSVGMLDPNCEARLLDEEGRPVNPGEAGELYIRGPNICLGYWKNETATKDSFDANGWLKTGDVMRVEGDRFWVVDRKKELIKVNALQVSPAELEAVLLGHEGVADVGVVGVLGVDGQERPRAYVQVREGARGRLDEADVQDYMKERVAKHKLLTGGVVFVGEVPRLASGKLHRKVLKEWAKRDAADLRAKL
jgi:acyl-CoA synthetase (AMP-forming)/AMP-acid ligase II